MVLTVCGSSVVKSASRSNSTSLPFRNLSRTEADATRLRSAMICPREVLFIRLESDVADEVTSFPQADLSAAVNVPADVVIVERERCGQTSEQTCERTSTREIQPIVISHAAECAVTLLLVDHVSIDEHELGFVCVMLTDHVIGWRAGIHAAAPVRVLRSTVSDGKRDVEQPLRVVQRIDERCLIR